MEIMSLFFKNFVVGLDIGPHSIKLVQFAKKKEGLSLVKKESREIISLPDQKSSAEEKLSKLKELLVDIPLKKSQFVVSINCPKTCARMIYTPPMSEGELREAIKIESKNYFPFPLNKSCFDFEVIGEVVEKDMKKLRVAVVASPKETVDETLNLLRQAGIKPDCLIPVPYALLNFYRTSFPDKSKTVSIIDIGERYTELVIFEGNNLAFSRKIPVASHDFTKALTSALVSDQGKVQLTLEEAEKIKREVGIPKETENRMIDGKVSTAQVLSMLRLSLEQLVTEIGRCFDYYRQETTGSEIDSMILLGDGAQLKGLSEALSEDLGIEVRVGDSPAMAIAMGAALSQGRCINLLPAELKEEAKRVLKRATLQSSISSFVIILVAIYLGMGIQISNFKKRIAVSKLEIASLKAQFENAKGQLSADKILQNEPYWEDVFKELSNVIPADIVLREMTMQDKGMRIKGAIVSKGKDGALSNFISNLGKGIFKDVRLITAQELPDKSAREFELECQVG